MSELPLDSAPDPTPDLESDLPPFDPAKAPPAEQREGPDPRKPDIQSGAAEEDEADVEPRPGIEAMRRRISKLFAQKRAAEENAAAERAYREALEYRLRELEARIASAPPPSNPGNPFEAPVPSATLDSRALHSVVQQALKPIVERLQAREQLDELAYAHERSWEAAADEFPEVARKGRLRQTAQSLLAQDPELARSPNGPYRAVLMARGLLADVPDDSAAKRAAGTAVPAAPGERPAAAQLRAQYKALLKKGIFTADDWAQAQQLRRAIAAAKRGE